MSQEMLPLLIVTAFAILYVIASLANRATLAFWPLHIVYRDATPGWYWLHVGINALAALLLIVATADIAFGLLPW